MAGSSTALDSLPDTAASVPARGTDVTTTARTITSQTLTANSHRHTGHDTDKTVLSYLVWRCELSRPDSPTSAFSVGVCRAAQALPVRPPNLVGIRKISAFSRH